MPGVNSLPYSRELLEPCFEKPLQTGPSFLCLFGRYNQGDVRLMVTDLVQPDVCMLLEMKLGRSRHIGHTRNMSHERDAAGGALPAYPETTGNERAKTVGTHGQAGPQTAPAL
jgi:hypothetical protein